MLDQITPLILTFNEAPNIQRSLTRLGWARRIVVVDSGSTDATLELLAAYPRVEVFVRVFDTHSDQWNFGLSETGIDTEWVLALDADYILPERVVEEIRTLEPVPSIVGYRARFRYCIAGQPIRSGAYPPVVVLYRRLGPRYVQDGHTQRVQVAGGVAELQGRIDHDDRKSLSRWLKSQHNYARQEAEHLAGARYADLNVIDRMRCRIWPMPFLMFGYCFVWRGGFLDGWRGLQYALERTYAELLLSLELLSRRLLGDPAAPE